MDPHIEPRHHAQVSLDLHKSLLILVQILWLHSKEFVAIAFVKAV